MNTVVFLVIAMVLFTMFRVMKHFNGKYRGMFDGSRMADFVQDYWRTSRSIEGFFFIGTIACIWLAIRHFEFSQFFAILGIGYCFLSLMCLIVLTVCQTIESLFAEWRFDRIEYRLNRLKVDFMDWKRQIKEDTVDMMSSYFLGAGSLAFVGIMLVSMVMSLPL